MPSAKPSRLSPYRPTRLPSHLLTYLLTQQPLKPALAWLTHSIPLNSAGIGECDGCNLRRTTHGYSPIQSHSGKLLTAVCLQLVSSARDLRVLIQLIPWPTHVLHQLTPICLTLLHQFPVNLQSCMNARLALMFASCALQLFPFSRLGLFLSPHQTTPEQPRDRFNAGLQLHAGKVSPSIPLTCASPAL